MNEELLGLIIPMLMQGADVMDILRAVVDFGKGGALRSDGLTAMINRQATAALDRAPAKPSLETVMGAAESFIDSLGFNPYSGGGQAAAGLTSILYNLAPDLVGTAIGIHNPEPFFKMLANGAGGINAAAGYGRSDLFNPYSVMQAHENTMTLAQEVFNLGVTKDDKGNISGINVDYSHGLNFEEMGRVTQRLLTSDLAYSRSESDNSARLNLEDEGDFQKFKDNLKSMGSELNKAASMVAKFTGDVDGALRIMDRMAGGNFLGGTAEQARAVAARAMDMAATIRVTSAMAGISPQEVFAQMEGLMQGLSSKLGVNSGVADASGLSLLTQDIAGMTSQSFTMWAAAHPDASNQQREQALLAINHRVMSFMDSPAEKMISMMVANKDRFTPEEFQRVSEALREGRVNDVALDVRRAIGEEAFDMGMSDVSVAMSNRYKAMETDLGLYRDLSASGAGGNIMEAAEWGSKKMMDAALSDTYRKLSLETNGTYSYYELNNEAELSALRNIAKRTGALTEETADAWTDGESLRSFLLRRGVSGYDINREVSGAKMSKAMDAIREGTMTSDEEARAVDALRGEIQAKASEGGITDVLAAELSTKLNDRGNLYDVANAFYLATTPGISQPDLEDKVRGLFGYKMTSGQAARLEKGVLSQADFQSGTFTAEEEAVAAKEVAGRWLIKSMADLQAAAFPEGKGISDVDAMKSFADAVMKRRGEGVHIALDDKDESTGLSATFNKSAERMMHNKVAGHIGNLTGDNLNRFVSEVSSAAMDRLRNDDNVNTIQDAFAITIREMGDRGFRGYKIDEYGRSLLTKMAESPGRYFNREALMSSAIDVINKRTMDDGSLAEAALASYRIGSTISDWQSSDQEKLSRFIESAGVLGASGLLYGGVSGEEAFSAGIDKTLAKLLKGKEGDYSGVANKAVSLLSNPDFKGDLVEALLESDGLTDEQKKLIDRNRNSFRNGVFSEAVHALQASVDIPGMSRSDLQQVRLQKAGGAASAAGAGTTQGAGANMAGAKSSVGITQEGVTGARQVLTSVDDMSADASQNVVRKTLGGTGENAARAIEESKAYIAKLREAASGFSEEDLQKLASGNADATLKESFGKTLGEKGAGGIDKAVAMLSTLSGTSVGEGDGRVSALKLLGGDDAEFKKLQGMSDKEWADVTKESGRSDSLAYDIFSVLKDINDSITQGIRQLTGQRGFTIRF